MAITSAEIHNQSFSIDRKGYVVDEVDVFLEHVADEIDGMNAQIIQLENQLDDRKFDGFDTPARTVEMPVVDDSLLAEKDDASPTLSAIRRRPTTTPSLRRSSSRSACRSSTRTPSLRPPSRMPKKRRSASSTKPRTRSRRFSTPSRSSRTIARILARSTRSLYGLHQRRKSYETLPACRRHRAARKCPCARVRPCRSGVYGSRDVSGPGSHQPRRCGRLHRSSADDGRGGCSGNSQAVGRREGPFRLSARRRARVRRSGLVLAGLEPVNLLTCREAPAPVRCR